MRTKPLDEAISTNTTCAGLNRVIEYVPGDGTRYVLVFAPIGGLVDGACDACLVSLINFPKGPSMLVELNRGFLAPTYVAEKMCLDGETAVTLAEIIAHFTGRQALTPEEYLKRANA